jgi:hypothetical protein
MKKERAKQLLRAVGQALLLGAASGVGKAIGLFLLTQLLR